MKKIFCVILVLLLTLSMTACTITMPEKEKDEVSSSTSEITTKKKKEENFDQGYSTTEETKVETPKMTPAELESELEKQEVKITSTKYVVQDDEHKVLYPDMLQAIIKNDSKYDIKNAIIAFAAWDENNLPVKIIGKHDYSDGLYVKKCNFSDINLVPGSSYGNDSGMALDYNLDNIAKFKAIIVSYETFDNETWENPLYETWLDIYEEKRYVE